MVKSYAEAASKQMNYENQQELEDKRERRKEIRLRNSSRGERL